MTKTTTPHAARSGSTRKDSLIQNYASKSDVKDISPSFEKASLLIYDNLDTLAQLGTGSHLTDSLNPDLLKNLSKRSRRKYLNINVILHLVAASDRSGGFLRKAYWNAYHCGRDIDLRLDGRLTSKYCKTRFCLVCNAIRTAKMIHSYGPELETWKDKYFFTLTKKNVPFHQLKDEVKLYFDTFKKIQSRFKKQHQRKQRSKPIGIRKFECTYNPVSDEYHPHFHVITDSKQTADDFITAWMSEFPKTTSKSAQDVRPADANSVVELFKYFSKLVSGPKSDKKKRRVYSSALDAIFCMIKGYRIIQPFGFRLPPQLKQEYTTYDIVNSYQYQTDDDGLVSWLGVFDKQKIGEYQPTAKDQNFLDLISDDELEYMNGKYNRSISPKRNTDLFEV